MEDNCHNGISDGDLEDLCLPLTTRRYRYQGMEQFIRIIHRFQDEFLDNLTALDNEYVVFYIDSATYQRDFLDSEHPIRSVLTSFEREKKSLIVKMVTPAHAQGACSLKYAVKEALERMGLRRVFLDYTAVPHEHPQGTKQPDAAWVPKKLPRNRTMVLEVAVSGSLARLRRDIDMWVDPAQGNVSIALAMKINRRRPEIQLEKYERDSQGSTQTVLIRKSEGQVTVSGSLIIPFESFVGRAPSKERDIQIVEEALREIAEDIWCAQQFE